MSTEVEERWQIAWETGQDGGLDGWINGWTHDVPDFQGGKWAWRGIRRVSDLQAAAAGHSLITSGLHCFKGFKAAQCAPPTQSRRLESTVVRLAQPVALENPVATPAISQEQQ